MSTARVNDSERKNQCFTTLHAERSMEICAIHTASASNRDFGFQPKCPADSSAAGSLVVDGSPDPITVLDRRSL